MRRNHRLATTILTVILALTPSSTSPLAQLKPATAPAPTPPHTGHTGQSANRQKRQPANVVQLQKTINQIISHTRFATTRWGILVESLDQKRVLFDRDAERLFVPASTLKLYTTATALAHLGPEYRFRTSVFAASVPDAAGVINGDLILYGRGDPNLSSRSGGGGALTSLDSLAEQLHRAGVREIRGDLIGDESYFSGPPLGVAWEWDDLQWSYGAEVSALSVDDNVIEVFILPGDEPATPAKVLTQPETSYVAILNKTQTAPARARQDIGIYRGLENNVLEVWGRVPVDGTGFQGYVAVHQPARYAATLLSESLARRGIEITGGVSRADAKYRQDHPLDVAKLRELAFVESVPLSEELRVINKTSQNLHAELLLRTLGAVAGEPTAEKGISAVDNLLQTARARRRGIAIQDGSGLSRQNLVAPATTVDLLRFVHGHAHRQVFLDSLPVAGVDGTLRFRMAGTAAQGNVQAKTGTLRYTSTLAGYVTTAGGERLVFCIMANDHTSQLRDVNEAVNEICASLAQLGA